ncbi:peptidoglycan DD-metalloendopeptidase family protein, partial [Staphylococcus xylosus]|uniref:peptidoglycan DD-metalloendopeptidase family protein n=1 Tax=Staphylococcus xylosus TaxID=1288 RepID=UPI0015C5578F
GTNVKAVASGRVSRVWNDYGGGKSIEIAIGKGLTNQYMHLSKQLVKKGQKVGVGDLIAKSGNTGNFTAGSGHLHFQLNKNGVPQSNVLEWLKGLGSGGKSGKWSGDVKKALKIAGLPTSASYVNAWKKQIQTESGGNPKALGGTDGLADGRAKGLVQVKPGTFNAYKASGHGNIWNGLDNLIAGMRYAKARYGAKGMLSAIGKGHGYATGGLINSSGLYNLAEEGHPEFVIPTDPSRQSDAMKLLAIARQRIEGNKKNKRPNQMRTPPNNGNDNSEMLNYMARQLEATQKQVELLTQLVASNQRIEQKPTGVSERDMSQAQGKRARLSAYSKGGVVF